MSSTGNVIKATVLTFAIAFCCFLPPIIHFISGPLGPAIGGYFAGNRFRLRPAGAAILGLIVGVTVGFLGPYLILAIDNLHFSFLITAFIIGFAIVYAGVLSGVAAWAGGSAAREASAT